MSRNRYLPGEMDQTFERERLELLSEIANPITFPRLEILGVDENWQCLEVGAGDGSVARWLADRVGPSGRVVATDIDTRFLEDLHLPTVEVRQHDIVNDDLETERYDLVHCRAVLMHLGQYQRALERMAAAVRPGGWLCIEEGDYGSLRAADSNYPAAETFNRTNRAMLEAIQAADVFDPYFGRRVRSLLELLDFVDIRQEGTTSVNRGEEAGAKWHRMNMQMLRERLVVAKILTEKDCREMERLFSDPAFYFVEVMLFGAWGRRAA